MIYNSIVCLVITIACSLSTADWKGDCEYSSRIEKFLNFLECRLPEGGNYEVIQVVDSTSTVFFGGFKKIVLDLLTIYPKVHTPTGLDTETASDLLYTCINKTSDNRDIALRELFEINKDIEIKPEDQRYWLYSFIKKLKMVEMKKRNFATQSAATTIQSATKVTQCNQKKIKGRCRKKKIFKWLSKHGKNHGKRYQE